MYAKDSPFGRVTAFFSVSNALRSIFGGGDASADAADEEPNAAVPLTTVRLHSR
jgi:hypothetical protein